MNNFFTSDIPTIGSLMYTKGYIVGTQGNLSLRVNQKDQTRIFITPTNFHKGFLRPDEILCVKMDGEIVQPRDLQPSSDLAMHLAIYQLRDDVKAIIHAHPSYVVASFGKIKLEGQANTGEVAEIADMMPDIKSLKQALPFSQKSFHTLLIYGHGTITIGKSLQDAFIRLEELEYQAKISYLTDMRK